jgi:type IV pilus assembly protein PilW
MSIRYTSGSAKSRSKGVTLIELMVAIAISLFMVGALVTLYVGNSVARTDLDRSSRQIENGRFAMDMMRDDIALAGYYGEVAPAEVSSFVEASPCTTTASLMGWSIATTIQAPAPIQGPNSSGPVPAIPVAWGCGTLNQRADTGYLVVRRLKPDALAASAAVANKNYLQSNGCKTATTPFVFAAGPGATNFTLTGPDCATAAVIREYQSRLYFVSDCGVCSGLNADTIPTLKVRELDGNQIIERVVADGIEDLQFEYGLDTTGDGVVDSYAASVAASAWSNVVAVRIRLIARTTEPSPGYTDSKTYDRGALFAAASAPTGTQNYKRRAFVALVALPNVAGPRETP